MLLQVLLMTYRWRRVLSQLNMNIRYEHVLQFIWIGLFFNQVLPSTIGGDGFRGFYLYKRGYSLTNTAHGVLIDRIVGLIALVILVAATLPLAFELIDKPIALWGLVTILISSIITLILVLMIERYTRIFSHWKFIKALFDLAQEARKLIFSFSPGIKLIAISFSIHLLSIIAIIILSIGMELGLKWTGVVIVMPWVTLIMVIPISIAGWGIREGAMVVGLGYLGVIPESALALSVLYGLLLLTIALPGGLIWLVRSNQRQE
jgi:uncharacterized membrane protein YbhN (UPF0104 family)